MILLGLCYYPKERGRGNPILSSCQKETSGKSLSPCGRLVKWMASRFSFAFPSKATKQKGFRAPSRNTAILLVFLKWVSFKHLAVGQNQWYHFEVGAPPILVGILARIGMFTGGTIWVLTHGHIAISGLLGASPFNTKTAGRGTFRRVFLARERVVLRAEALVPAVLALLGTEARV